MKESNSVHEMVDALKRVGPMTETEIFKAAFGYDRNKDKLQSNKKYASMLRRGMQRGLIERVEAEGLGRAKFAYYAPRVVKVSCSAEMDNEMYNQSI
tara:strand:- start:5758 stop:6048 length:291 start_codon:yes stop_codon:yes gene_type:complete